MSGDFADCLTCPHTKNLKIFIFDSIFQTEMASFERYNESIGETVVSIFFQSFTPDDGKLFRRFLEIWFKWAQMQLNGGHAPESFLLATVNDNSLALNESSDTISEKWITLFSQNKIWASLFCEGLFKLKVDKVLKCLKKKRKQVSPNTFNL